MKSDTRLITTIARSLRRLAASACAVLFLFVLASWIASYVRPHGVTVSGVREYALFARTGVIQFHYSIKTDVVQHGWNAWAIEEVGFQPADEPATVSWRYRGPRVMFSQRRVYQEGEVLMGSYVPEPSTGRTTALGEWTRVIGVPHWPVALVLALPTTWTALALRRRWIGRRRRRAGLCPRCGYDLRETPERCPECGLERDSILALPAKEVSRAVA
jgi:hypothetical protein